MPSSPSVIVSPEAEDDLQAIAYYTLAHWGQDQSDRRIDELFAVFERLARFPNLGKARDHLLKGARSHKSGSHVVIYRPEKTAIEIIRVLHVRMDAEQEFARE